MVNSEIKVSNLDLSPENGIAPTEKRFSKVNNKVCKLKMKIFSCDGVAKEIEYKSESDISPVTSVDLKDEKMFNKSDDNMTTEYVSSSSESDDSQKSYSVATVRERLREAKFSSRQKFRRLCIDHKKFYSMVKNKISSDDFKLLKGILASDVMAILNVVVPDVIKGKQINTLLGLSALSKELRLAGQSLQMPLRMGLSEEKRTGAVTKKRYQDLSSAYNDFIKAVFAYCYGDDYSMGATEIAETAEASTSDDRMLDNVKI